MLLLLPTAASFSFATTGSLERQPPLQRLGRLWRQLLLLLLLLWLLLLLLLSWRQPVTMELHHSLPVLVHQEVSLCQLHVVHAHKELAEAALRPALGAQGRRRHLLAAGGTLLLLLLLLLHRLLLLVRCGNEASVNARGPLRGQPAAKVCPCLDLEGRQRLENVVCMTGRRQAVTSRQHDLGMRRPGLIFEGRVQACCIVPGGVGHVGQRAPTAGGGGGGGGARGTRSVLLPPLLLLAVCSAVLATMQ